jgi:23S rRNA pseudouridine2605 synthase
MNTRKGGDPRKSGTSARGKVSFSPKHSGPSAAAKKTFTTSKTSESRPKPSDTSVRSTNVKDEEKTPTSKPYFKPRERKGDPLPSFNEDEIRLNKYLANAGVCSRREADVIIQTGVVSINGKIITELGYKVRKGDKVQYDGETINAEAKRYVLLNKPKGFITTMDDPLGRKTVMRLVYNACKERVYPVGRLDRETTGLLLFTNDGDLAKKLTHPRYEAKKIYQVETDKPVTPEHIKELLEGIDLEDGRIACDKAEYVKDSHNSREVGVEIHSGKNRIVRRMFEKLGYVVIKLDRVQFASLTKKDLPRGFYRHLTDQEISFLRMTKNN